MSESHLIDAEEALCRIYTLMEDNGFNIDSLEGSRKVFFKSGCLKFWKALVMKARCMKLGIVDLMKVMTPRHPSYMVTYYYNLMLYNPYKVQYNTRIN